MSGTLFEQLTKRATTQYTRFNELSVAGKIAVGVGSIFASVASYVVYYRVTDKMRKFNSYTTSMEALDGMDLTGKTAIITGSNTGIGKQTAKTLYAAGCNVIIACRTPEKGEAARSDIISSTSASTATIEVMALDLSSLQSVRDFAVAYTQKDRPINYLINNAGIMALPEFEESNEGYEKQFAVCHVGHMYLTQLLLPTLLKNKARVITLSSTAHRYMSFSAMNDVLKTCEAQKDGPGRDGYEAWRNYGIAKTANILFARELHRRYAKMGLTSCSLHPGAVLGSDLGRNAPKGPMAIVRMVLFLSNVRFIMNNMKSLDQGAATTLRCVSLPNDEFKGGHWYFNCQSGQDNKQLQGASIPRTYENYERDSLEVRLWTLTEQLITQKGFELEL